MFSPHGNEGYPSSVNVVIRYELRDPGQLRVTMTTTNVGAEPTVTNMTLHPYFDLKGQNGTAENSVLDYSVHAPTASHFLTLDSHSIPTGEIASVSGTCMDFSKPRQLHESSDEFQGYDHYFVSSNESSLDGPLGPLLTVTAPPGDHGLAIEMEVSSNQPGFQMYTANGFSSDGSPSFAKFGSLAIEPSGFIDATNNASFPTVELCPVASTRARYDNFLDHPDGRGYESTSRSTLATMAYEMQGNFLRTMSFGTAVDVNSSAISETAPPVYRDGPIKVTFHRKPGKSKPSFSNAKPGYIRKSVSKAHVSVQYGPEHKWASDS